MAYITLPETISNSTSADADEVMSNFNALVSGLSDGTKDINILGLTCGATSSFHSILPASDNAYDIGDATHQVKDLYVAGETKGANVVICGGANYTSALASATYYVGVGGYVVSTASAEYGFTAPKDGSILSLAIHVACTSYTGTGTITGHVYKNGSSVFSISSVSVNAVGNFSQYSTQARGTDTFSAGDYIQLVVIGGAGLNSVGHVTMSSILVFDT